MMLSLARWSMRHRRTIVGLWVAVLVGSLAFALSSDNLLKLIGLSLASAVLLDAFVIRTLLLPAVLQLLGPRAWWFPQSLARRIPSIAVEPRASASPLRFEPAASDTTR